MSYPLTCWKLITLHLLCSANFDWCSIAQSDGVLADWLILEDNEKGNFTCHIRAPYPKKTKLAIACKLIFQSSYHKVKPALVLEVLNGSQVHHYSPLPCVVHDSRSNPVLLPSRRPFSLRLPLLLDISFHFLYTCGATDTP